MDKKTLMSIPEILEIEIKEIKNTTPPSKMRRLLKDAMVEAYELEGTNEEINANITDILSDSIPTNEDDAENNQKKKRK